MFMYRNYDSEVCHYDCYKDPISSGISSKQEDADLPVVTHLVLAGVFAALMLVAFATFWQSGEALFMVVISALYLAMYMGTPYLFYRINPALIDSKTTSFEKALKLKVGTYTGPLSGFEAMAQVLTVPIALLIAFSSMGVILFMVS